MAETSDKDQRTEPATPKRRGEARQHGQVAQSQELNAAVILLCGIALLTFVGGQLAYTLMDCLRFGFDTLHTKQLNSESVVTLLTAFAKKTIPVVALITVPVIIVSAACAYAQVGFQISPEAIQWDLSRISPFKGLPNLFQARSFIRVLFSIVKTAAIVTVAYLMVKSELPKIGLLDHAQLSTVLSFTGSLLLRAALGTCITLFLIGLADLYYQRWQFERDLKMTKQEVKEEVRQTDGDPAVKGQIRRKQREIAMRRMMAEVPKATVVVTNPTHFAVALKYKTGENRAPKVVAKGKDIIALRIREIAKENNVPIVENPPLAQSLYKGAEIDEEIPPMLYRAVAELLSYVYRLKGRL